MTNQRNGQTREQMRREKIRTALVAAAALVLWAVLTLWSIRIWAEHPAEQHISGTVYVASVRQGGIFNDHD